MKTCSNGKVLNQQTNQCECPNEAPYWSGLYCVSCSGGSIWNQYNSECIRCGEGSSYNNLNGKCELDSPPTPTPTPTPTPKPIPTPPTPMCYHGKIYSKDIKQC